MVVSIYINVDVVLYLELLTINFHKNRQKISVSYLNIIPAVYLLVAWVFF